MAGEARLAPRSSNEPVDDNSLPSQTARYDYDDYDYGYGRGRSYGAPSSYNSGPRRWQRQDDMY